MPFAKQKLTAILPGETIESAVFGERTRLNDIANATRWCPLGGARETFLIDGTGVQDVFGYIDVKLDGTLLAGYTVTAVVEVITLNAATTIEPRIYDVTTIASPVLYTTTNGSASASTTWARQELIFDTLPLAVKYYRLRVNKSNATYAAGCIGYLELKAP